MLDDGDKQLCSEIGERRHVGIDGSKVYNDRAGRSKNEGFCYLSYTGTGRSEVILLKETKVSVQYSSLGLRNFVS